MTAIPLMLSLPLGVYVPKNDKKNQALRISFVPQQRYSRKKREAGILVPPF
jgi:hypothetical protein